MRRDRYITYGGEPTPNNAPVAPPANPAGTAHPLFICPTGCKPNTLRKPKNIVKTPNATRIGVDGRLSSATTPMTPPTRPAGSNTLISPHWVCLRLTPPRTIAAVKSSASSKGMANVSGNDSASSGIEIRPEPNPVMPRMKYALITMQMIMIMSAIAAS